MYAIGDIHGRLDLLRSAIDAVAEHAEGRRFRVVCLGDYVDRGPDSAGVIDFLIQLRRRWSVVCLKGNHEELMVRALTQPGANTMAPWLDNGGLAALASYGLSPDADVAEAIPGEHLRWLAGLPLTTADPHRIYVHAGLLPRCPMHRQTEETCLWIRERFLRGGAGDFEAHVVHGHSPIWEHKPNPAEPELLEHRTNLDTAAFATGVLSIGVFDTEQAGGPLEILKVIGAPLPQLIAQAEPAAVTASPPKRWKHIVQRIGSKVHRPVI